MPPCADVCPVFHGMRAGFAISDGHGYLQGWIVLKAACSFGRDCLRLYFLGFLLAGILKSQVTDGALSMNGLTWEVGVTLMQHGVMVQYFQNLLYCY